MANKKEKIGDGRGCVRTAIFTLAALVVLVGLAVGGWVRNANSQRIIENNYRRAVIGLSESVGSIDISLKKCLCSGTGEQFSVMAAQLLADSRQAKQYLGELPASEGAMSNVNVFFAQVGDYAMYLAGENQPDDQAADTLIALSNSAGELRISVEDFLARMDDANDWDGEIQRLSMALKNPSSPQAAGGIEMADGALDGFTALSYDGCYSCHINQMQPAYTEGLAAVDMETAMGLAAEFSGIERSMLEYAGKDEGVTDAYIFESYDTEISVTVDGGVVEYMLCSRELGERTITATEAKSRADRFLRDRGYKDCAMQYSEVRGQQCVLTYATVNSENIVIYSDLIRLTVSLDLGDVIAFDASEYIMHHTDRDDLTAHKTAAQAAEKISSLLTVNDCRLTVIPTKGENELLCYEFWCETWEGGQALVYINAQTLSEECVLLLVESGSGLIAV